MTPEFDSVYAAQMIHQIRLPMTVVFIVCVVLLLTLISALPMEFLLQWYGYSFQKRVLDPIERARKEARGGKLDECFKCLGEALSYFESSRFNPYEKSQAYLTWWPFVDDQRAVQIRQWHLKLIKLQKEVKAQIEEKKGGNTSLLLGAMISGVIADQIMNDNDLKGISTWPFPYIVHSTMVEFVWSMLCVVLWSALIPPVCAVLLFLLHSWF